MLVGSSFCSRVGADHSRAEGLPPPEPSRQGWRAGGLREGESGLCYQPETLTEK